MSGYDYDEGFGEGYEEGYNTGHQAAYQELMEHLWHAAQTADPSITQEEFHPEDLPGIVEEALEEALMERSALDELINDLGKEIRTLRARLYCSRHDRKAREKRILRNCKSKVQNARRELRESKERSRQIQHELYVALKLSEEREQELRRSEYIAAHDLAAIGVLADGLGLPGTEERPGPEESDFDRLSGVLDRCYTTIQGLRSLAHRLFEKSLAPRE